MLKGRIWRLFRGGAIGSCTSLDSLLEELADTDSLERRKALWQEVIRRFVQDVERACRVAGHTDPQEMRGIILDEALRGVEPGSAKYFSRQLVRIMKKHLGQNAVSKVLHGIYLRQFLHELPVDLVPYVEGLLDQDGHVEWLADRRNENFKEVQKRCAEGSRALPHAIEREYDDAEIIDRTDGVWTIAKLKER